MVQYENSIVVSQKMKIELPYDSAIPLLGLSKKTESRTSRSYPHTHVHSSIIHSSQEVEANQISIDG